MRIRRCQLMLVMSLSLLTFCKQGVAETDPWFGDMLVKFPDALLLEQEPSRLVPPSQPSRLPQSDNAGRSRVFTCDPNSEAVIAEPSIKKPARTSRRNETRADGGQQNEASRTLEPAQYLSPGIVAGPPQPVGQPRGYARPPTRSSSAGYVWQVLPAGVLYRSYVAGEKEPRMGTAILTGSDLGTNLESTIGGRLGLLRKGTVGPINPEGWQWDLESAAMLRQNFEEELDVDATDFRIGSVLTYKRGATAFKGGIYHLSSHVGDEYLERNPTFQRINYSRNALLFGVYHYLTPELAMYGEVAYGITNDGGSEPFEFQFGSEYHSLNIIRPTGGPFAAINVHMREEFDFGGALNILAGWEWQGPTSGHRFRIGGQYYEGRELQWSFFGENIQLVGAGIWFDY